MDHGILKNFKITYRKMLIQHIFARSSSFEIANEDANCVNVQNAIQYFKLINYLKYFLHKYYTEKKFCVSQICISMNVPFNKEHLYLKYQYKGVNSGLRRWPLKEVYIYICIYDCVFLYIQYISTIQIIIRYFSIIIHLISYSEKVLQ